jgi:GMP synthase-like glutamine amidotransferase
MRVLFIQQEHTCAAGLVGDSFAALGYDIEEFTVVPAERHHAPDVTVTFPDPLRYDAIVALGATWAVYDDAIGNWIHDEIAFTRKAIAGGVPVLGICFGGQMLAAALGGEVARAPEPEIGWYTIDAAAPNGTGPGLISAGPWFQWHFDRFTVPAGVPVLARTPLASQAFTAGRSLGLQFHPELTPSVLSGWLDDGGDAELAAQGIDPEALIARTRDLAGETAPRAHDLVRSFVRDVATAPVDATILTPEAR